MKRLLPLIILLFTFSNSYSQDQDVKYSKFRYAEIENGYNQIGNNSHTASKPFIKREVNQYYNLNAYDSTLSYNKKGWWGRKLFDERFVTVKKDDFWFSIDPVMNFQVGKDLNSEYDYTYVNTRGFYIEGQLGSQFSFQTAFYESQARFPDYVSDWTREHKGVSGAGLVPGQGIAKSFKEGGYDYPMAEAQISYTPSKFFNFQFGTGKNFIGDGYRSMFLSDAGFNYPYFKINTTFWNIKYTNYWMFMQDIRPEVAVNGNVHQKKFVTMHHLSWNITDRINIGLFEAIVWADSTGTRGFDVSYLNPIIFYRPIEFSLGSQGGNALIGFSTKIKITNTLQFFGQAVLDEFTLSEVKANDGYWANKFAFQVGLNYYNAFGVENLQIKTEVNWSRPYTFSHREPLQNYGHFNQPLGHPWGSNFIESATVIRYRYERFFADAKLILGRKGFDTPETNWGGDIYKPYTTREQDYENVIAQGNTGTLFFTNLKAGYIVNPAVNLKLFVDFTFRDFSILDETDFLRNSSGAIISFGVRTDLFNTYYDF
ncbi:MAG: gliding motility protein RemB [Flavobacteriales bacterium]|nr:gliding motility protein RemB [Flavobacteriales bacterium]